MKLAIIAITRNGTRLGARLQAMAVDADLFVAEKFVAEAGASARPFAGELREVVRENWRQYQGFVFVMATGIVVRLIAPHLEAKDRDPAVVVVDEAGRFAISLLSGHLGGANELARDVAELLGGQAVITTATDVNELPSFDLLAKEEGWGIDDLGRVKSLNALLLAGEEIAVVDPSGRVAARFAGRGRLSSHAHFAAALQSGAAGCVFVTNRQLPPQALAGTLLVLRPKNLVLGLGCNRGTPSQSERPGCLDVQGALRLPAAALRAHLDHFDRFAARRHDHRPRGGHAAEELRAPFAHAQARPAGRRVGPPVGHAVCAPERKRAGAPRAPRGRPGRPRAPLARRARPAPRARRRARPPRRAPRAPNSPLPRAARCRRR
jgi:cobalamin biosynthesis protein CbiG